MLSIVKVMSKITCLTFKSYTVHTSRIERTNNVVRVSIQYGFNTSILLVVVVVTQPAILRMRSVERF